MGNLGLLKHKEADACADIGAVLVLCLGGFVPFLCLGSEFTLYLKRFRHLHLFFLEFLLALFATMMHLIVLQLVNSVLE